MTVEEAFDKGWDTPERFGYTGCDLCPGAWIYLQQTDKHAAAHERWAKEGRPAEFEQDDINQVMAQDLGISPEVLSHSMDELQEKVKIIKADKSLSPAEKLMKTINVLMETRPNRPSGR